MPKTYDIPKILKGMGIRKNSKKLSDYEAAKHWFFYSAISQAEYEKYLKETATYIGI